jgi:hypothetical protein
MIDVNIEYKFLSINFKVCLRLSLRKYLNAKY